MTTKIQQLSLFFFLLIFGVLAGCASSPMYEEVINSHPPDQNVSAADKTIPILIVKHAYHTGVILPADAAAQISTQIVTDYTEQSGRDYQYWEFGWGDERFYTAEYNDVGLAVRAMAAPTSALLHVIGLNRHPDNYFRQVKYKRERVTPAGYRNMLEYIHRTAVFNAQGKLTQTIKAREVDRLFYKARGKYALMNNCNHWTAGLLAVGGLPVRPNTMRADSIFTQLGGIDFSK